MSRQVITSTRRTTKRGSRAVGTEVRGLCYDRRRMTEVQPRIEGHPLVLRVRPAIEMTPDQFFEFCRINRDLRIERTAKGDLLIMSPTGGETGARGMRLLTQLGVWAERDGTGVAFDSSTGFTLPNGATRSPDATWVRRERLARLTAEQRRKFLPLSPDFAVELLSPSDDRAAIEMKMAEYIATGTQLAWLIDPDRRQVVLYGLGGEPRSLDAPTELVGAPVLAGFVLDLKPIWDVLI